MSLHGRVERAFAVWAKLVCRARIWVLLVMTAFTAFCVSWIPGIRFENSAQSFLHREDPARVAYEEFRARFGQDDFVLVAVRPPNLFAPRFLEKLRDFHRDLEAEVPHLEDVQSMLNARSTWGRADELIVEDLFEEWPETPAQLERIRERALSDPLYENLLFSGNYTYTTVTVRPVVYSEAVDLDPLAGFGEDGAGQLGPPLSDAELTEFLDAIAGVVARYEADDFDIEVVGSAITNHSLNEALEDDVTMFVVGSLCVMACILFVLFRSWPGVVLPLVVVLFALFSTVGILVMIDIPASVALNLVPILLLAAGVCDAVHILTIVNQQLAEGAARDDAIAFGMGHSGLAVFMTSITTAAGFLSFVSADLAPVSHLGIVAPIGIMLAFLYTVTLLPALLSVAPLRAPENQPERMVEKEVGNLLSRVGGLAVRNPWRVLGAGLVALLLSVIGMQELRVSQDAVRWFPREDEARSAQELLDREFGGTTSLEIVIDTGEPGGLYDPDLLRRMGQSVEFIEGYESHGILAGKVFSVLDVLKATHQALNGNSAEYYVLPTDRQLVAQELLLFENAGSDDLQELVDTQFRFARLSVRVRSADAMLYREYVRGLEAGIRQIMGDDVGIEMTGIMRLLARTMAGVVYSMMDSYLLAVVVITPLMIVLLGSLRQGLLAMIPNLLPIAITLGVMGWAEMPIDMSSMLVGGIIIGLAVDDTIHFMHKFQRYYAEMGEAGPAIQASLQTAGAALLFTTLILGAGFVVMEFAYMKNASQFGQLACLAIVAAFAADILIAPALLVLAVGGERRLGPRQTARRFRGWSGLDDTTEQPPEPSS